MTSATKFIAGHSDVTGGILSVKDQDLGKKIYFLQNSEGGGLAPFDCWLCLRGLKTMSLRMERQQSNCMAMALYASPRSLQPAPYKSRTRQDGIEQGLSPHDPTVATPRWPRHCHSLHPAYSPLPT